MVLSLNDRSRDQGWRLTARQSDLIVRLARFAVPRLSARTWAAWAIAAGALVLLILGRFMGGEPHYVTRPVASGSLAVTINATGSLAPREQVDVGAEISGRIDSVTVDFDARVRKGQVLARINTDQLQAQLAQAHATLDQSRATLKQNEDAIQRDRALAKSGAVSPQQLVAAEGDYDRARAGVALAAAQVKQDETMLSKATIYSPINGIVLDRRVSAGQTIVATMQTPVLFTLASDLSRMELKVAISETDIGQVHAGSPASFTVDAYPARPFAAQLISIRNAPQIVRGVVTYQGVLLVENRDGLLKPGMTARVSIEAARLRNALLVPNDALRYAPPERPGSVMRPRTPLRSGAAWGRVWILQENTVAPRDVRLGPSNGKQTAIFGGDLRPGEQVIVSAKPT